jgi:uncharacterized membrane protein YsdA (DUF1294 family)
MLTAFATWTLVASLTTAAMFVCDKRAAKKGSPRVSENTLLGWSLVGGWPGGWIASKLLRHKTQKLSFRVRFVLAAIINVGVMACLWYSAS